MSLARDNMPTKKRKSRRPRRNVYIHYIISSLLLLSVVEVTLVKLRVHESCYLDGWLLRGEGVGCALADENRTEPTRDIVVDFKRLDLS